MYSSKKYVIYLGGGLANRMFHLAFGYSLKAKGCDLLFDDHSFKSEFEHDNIDVTTIFPNLDMQRMPNGMYKYVKGNRITDKILRRLSWLTGEKYYISHSKGYDKSFVNSISKPGYIIGSFQNEEYFFNIANEIHKRFSFKPFFDEKNLWFINQIKDSESVAIHVRKGDGYSSWKRFQGTCPLEYYKTAIEYMQLKLKNPRFFVFTDSPTWVKENFSWLKYDLVDWNPTVGWGNHFDMQLMSMCKHNIIANSTYSWWGAWLNNNLRKIVIAPRYWYSKSISLKEQRNIVSDLWIKM